MNLCEGIPELVLFNWILQLCFPFSCHAKVTYRVKTLASLYYYTEYQMLFPHDDYSSYGFVE